MSYGCEICFKQLPGDQVYDFLLSFKQKVSELIPQIAEMTVYSSPIMRTSPPREKITQFSREQVLAVKDWAKLSVFQYRYFYNKKLQLLGVYSVQPCLHDHFDCCICFQNSTDQDYKYDTWNGVKYFEKVAEKWKTATVEEVTRAYSEHYHEDVCDLSDKDRLEYYRRWAAYMEIWENFMDTLFFEDNVVYLSLFGYYDFDQMNRFLSHLKDAINRELE